MATFGLRTAALCLAIAGSASADPSSPAAPVRALTLREAVDYARAHQPAVRAALARIAAAQARADVPRAEWLPTFGVTAQLLAATANQTTGSYLGGGPLDLPRIGGTRATATGTFRPYASTLVAAGVNQELFDFGRIAAKTAVADAAVAGEREQADAELLDVTYDVEEAYFAVLAAKSVLAASEGAYERTRVHRDLAKAGVGAGLRSPIELTRAEADLAKFDIGRVRARGGVATAQTVLAAVVGAPDAALDASVSPPTKSELPSLDEAVRRASARDPLLLEALAQIRVEEAETRAIGAELRPDVSLTATLSGRAGGAPPSGNGIPADDKGWVPNVPNWDVGVVLSWPLFDGVVNARKNASVEQERVGHEQVALARQRETARVRETYVAVQVARTALPGLEQVVRAAVANDAQADARFKAGLGTSVELADAEALRADAEIQLVLGQFELARTRAAFGRAIAEGISK